MADWLKIKTEYITTDTSYRKLAEKYGVSKAQIYKVGGEEGWVELREQFRSETLAKSMEAVCSQEVDRAVRIQRVSDKLLDKIEAIVDCTEPTDFTAKAIRALTAAVKDLKEVQGIRSKLDDEEQEARIANLRKQAKQDEEDTGVIEVVFDAGPEEWNE